MTSTSDLLRMNAAIGNKLDTAARDPEQARFLLRARRAVRQELETRHAQNERTLEPYRFTHVDADGYACYDEV